MACGPDRRGALVVAVDTESMGRGSKELGRTLMKGFLFAVTQLPELPGGKKWKVCVNTAVPYADGQSPEQFMNNTQNNNLRIEPRTVVILTAE